MDQTNLHIILLVQSETEDRAVLTYGASDEETGVRSTKKRGCGGVIVAREDDHR